ncbi:MULTISPECIES: hypothetical protein [unclassified Tenacibaculum]|uniref:hypothetical protein n=1 Tax=unclassified Tenacibaculum TaxID=2635139 RepID=UPI001F382469|nr:MULTISPECIES: hypothetical protein [unclassified Tenacibaculum]MCF2874058.1 hypothetical protein [Tenacibaculum sp. Cn5-1]MCF2934639.1 hypothetical protein [Tenacibaculum sp. Cn5-34]MCG7510849.1 hypothetical protein [Tenacibaculum sp. Cn5-46]
MIKNISNLGTLLNKKDLKSIIGGGDGFVQCENGATFSSTAESEQSVIINGSRWCQDHGHGRLSWYYFIEVNR